MDIAITQDSNGFFDILPDRADLQTEQGLRTAIMLSLFTDARAHADDAIPDNTDQRGYWADHWPVVNADVFGSRMWLLAREKQTTDVLMRAREYCYEALQWLIDDGVAASIEVDNEWLRASTMAMHITIKRGANVLYSDTFNYELRL